MKREKIKQNKEDKKILIRIPIPKPRYPHSSKKGKKGYKREENKNYE